MKIKFNWNGIKVDGELNTAWYSESNLTNYPEGTITVYAKTYKAFPKIDGLNAENETDSMTDYFEKDKIRVTPENIHYKEVKEALNKMKEHDRKKMEKRNKAA